MLRFPGVMAHSQQVRISYPWRRGTWGVSAPTGHLVCTQHLGQLLRLRPPSDSSFLRVTPPTLLQLGLLLPVPTPVQAHPSLLFSISINTWSLSALCQELSAIHPRTLGATKMSHLQPPFPLRFLINVYSRQYKYWTLVVTISALSECSFLHGC